MTEKINPVSKLKETEVKTKLTETFLTLQTGMLKQIKEIAKKMESIMDEPKSWKWKEKTWKESLRLLSNLSDNVDDGVKFLEEQFETLYKDFEELKKSIEEKRKTDLENNQIKEEVGNER